MAAKDRMVWIGLTTSGPDPDTDSIESIHVRITDKEMEVLAEAAPLAVGADASEAEAPTLALVRRHVGRGAGLLAGVRVQEIRLFLAAQMPALFGYLHYRNIDVGTVRELVRRWYPEAHEGRPSVDPELDEIALAMSELRYYRASVFSDDAPMLSDDRLSDDRLSDDRLSDDRLSDDRLSDDRLSDDGTERAAD